MPNANIPISPYLMSTRTDMRLYSTMNAGKAISIQDSPKDTTQSAQPPHLTMEIPAIAPTTSQREETQRPTEGTENLTKWDILQEDEADPFAKTRQLMEQIDRDEIKNAIRIIDRYAYILERFTIRKWRKQIYAIVWNIGPEERKSLEYERLIVGRSELARSIKMRFGEEERNEAVIEEETKLGEELDVEKGPSEGLAEHVPAIRWRHRERRLRMAREQLKSEKLEKSARLERIEKARLEMRQIIEREKAERGQLKPGQAGGESRKRFKELDLAGSVERQTNLESAETANLVRIGSPAKSSQAPHFPKRGVVKGFGANDFGSRRFSTQISARNGEGRPPHTEVSSTTSESDSIPKTATQSSPLLPESTHAPKLTHLNESSEVHMVDVGAKAATHRTAIATGSVQFGSAETYALVKEAKLKKGDVLSVARVAGIMAAKNCPLIIPLCHPISITGSSIELDLYSGPGQNSSVDLIHGGINVQATVKCFGPTGVEMEALTAVSGACLTIVDMIKAVDRNAVIGPSRVVLKTGGRSGDSGSWTHKPSALKG
jgi:molybdenum cofactor biosynthesis protein MoaC